MRLPYVPDAPPTNTPEEADILARVQARRGPGGLIPLDRALLHSFPIADGWNSFFGAIRTQTSLSQVIREVIICRVAVLNGACAAESAVIKYTDAMTTAVTVPDEVFQELKGLFNDQEVVEITATVAAYNCVGRLLVALDVGEKNQ
ncbi:hypothetical protein N8T08_006604 [Aspergillus melleus]|uniref:Uncharacterized protein n=1 Tax=Aspergillus melleus TaxID=138277 RepID=A0ACC3BG45_9EURO|nr:hypothetical protein N8T08_006604 [Aspergillus melleus]